jgi:hypothetical protein
MTAHIIPLNAHEPPPRKIVTIPTQGTESIFEPLPPIPFLVEGLRIAPGAVTILAGYGFSGKTIAAQTLAICVASGTCFLGFKTRKGRVLHLDYEQGRRVTDERYQRIAKGMGLTEEDLCGNLDRAIFPNIYLDSPDAELILEDTISGYDLVIIDSFRASSPSMKENDSTARIPLDMLNRISDRTGATIVVIHHAKKPSADSPSAAKFSLRGSGAIFDALQTLFCFNAVKGQPTRVEHEKCRIYGTELDDFGIRVVDVPIGDDPRGGVRLEYLDAAALEVALQASPSAQLETAKTKIVEYLKNLEGRTFVGSQSQLAALLSMAKKTTNDAVNAMINDGRVAAVRGRYTLVREGAPPTGAAAIGVEEAVQKAWEMM